MRLLVTGAGGMLGADVRRAGRRAGHELVLLGHAELDIADADAVQRGVDRADPQAIVNCAAWTDVDGAAIGDIQRSALEACAFVAVRVGSGDEVAAEHPAGPGDQQPHQGTRTSELSPSMKR